MAKPTEEQKQGLGPLVTPFERYNRLYPESERQIGPGEKVIYHAIFDAIEGNGGYPPNVLRVSPQEIEPLKKYLWVITTQGLFMALENVDDHPNKEINRLCHTNLTGGKKAYQGRELWFLNDNSILLNFWSGRYGHPDEGQEKAIVDYFNSVGYKKIVVNKNRW